ncbi:hypothetical protein M422DRAFT_63167 [Sphaerobolus stellatus SS14]|nr:hypothetical protein M422DRAFT_63167 [Sphaerobolus stellatus SS14]
MPVCVFCLQAFAPHHEPQHDIRFEKAFFEGQHLESISYGINIAIFALNIYFLILKPTKDATNTRKRWGFVAYLVFLLAASTINAASGIKYTELLWIDNRDFPGGPIAFSKHLYSNPMRLLGDAAYIAASFLSGGLLLWRCFIFYKGTRWLLSLLTLAFVVSTALSIVAIYGAAHSTFSDTQFISETLLVLAVPAWSLSIVCNVVLSMLLVYRLLSHRQSMSQVFGTMAPNSKLYVDLSAIFVESAALNMITSLIHVITFATSSNAHFLILGILVQVEAIAPQLVLLRVALRGFVESSIVSGSPNTRSDTHISFTHQRNMAQLTQDLESSPSEYGQTINA